MPEQWATTDDHSPVADGGWATTDDHAPGLLAQAGQAFTNFGKDVGSAAYGASAEANHLTANIFGLLDRGAAALASATGTPKIEAFKRIEQWAQQGQQDQQQQAQQLAGDRNGFIPQATRGIVQGALQLPQYAIAAGSPAGPVAGLAALGALQESDKGFWPAMQSAAVNGATGGALTIMGPASRPVRLAGTAAMTYAQSRLAGDDHTTALAKATAMGGMNSLGPGEGVTAGDMVRNALPDKVGGWYANPNPAEASGLDYLQQKGASIDAGTASGSPFLRRVTQMVDSSPVGAVMAREANLKNTQVLRGLAAEHVAEATPDVSADTHYGDFQTQVNDPANARSYPLTDKNGDPLTDENGQPKTESIQMPAEVGVLKPTLSKIADQMSWMTPSDLSKNKGYSAILKILKGPDVISADQAELGLSGMKREAREGTDPRSVGLMKFLIPRVQDLIDGSVLDVGGQGALDSLQQGRASAAAEAGAQWLTDEFQTAQQEGGFAHADRLWADWNRLPTESKQTMFSQDQIGDLNNMFLGFKRLQESANSSNTALALAAGHSAAQVTGLFMAPHIAIPEILSTAAMAKLLRSPWGVKLLTQGLELPAGSPQAQPVISAIKSISQWQPPAGQPPAAGAAPTYKQWRDTLFNQDPTSGLWVNQDDSTRYTDERLHDMYEEQYGAGSQGTLVDKLQGYADAAMQRIKDRGTFSGTRAPALVPVDDLGDMAIWGAAKIAQGTAKFGAWSKEMVADAGPQIKPYLDDLFAKAQKIYARHVDTTAQSLPNTRQLMKLYQQGEHGKDWYAKTHAELVDMFGPDAEMMEKFLAGTSPNNTVAANVTQALKAYKQWKTGQPFEGFLPAHIDALNAATSGEDFGGLKVNSFLGNLAGDPEPVTVDRWIRRAFGFQKDTITDQQYKFMDYTLTSIAHRNQMEPRQLQAAIWTAIKEADAKGASTTSLPFEALLRKKLAADPQMQQLIARAKGGEIAPPRP